MGAGQGRKSQKGKKRQKGTSSIGKKPGSERDSPLTLGTIHTDECVPNLHQSQVRPRVFSWASVLSVTQSPEP